MIFCSSHLGFHFCHCAQWMPIPPAVRTFSPAKPLGRNSSKSVKVKGFNLDELSSSVVDLVNLMPICQDFLWGTTNFRYIFLWLSSFTLGKFSTMGHECTKIGKDHLFDQGPLGDLLQAAKKSSFCMSEFFDLP